MSSKAQTLQVNHLLKDGCVSITSFCKAKKNGAPQVNWENFWTCLFLGRRFWSFDLFWRLAFSIGGICCILSRVAVHIKAVCIRMNSRKVCKSSLQAFSVTCDFFDEPGNLPLIKKSWVFVKIHLVYIVEPLNPHPELLWIFFNPFLSPLYSLCRFWKHVAYDNDGS